MQLKNDLLNAGLTDDEYRKLLPDIREENWSNLKMYSVITSIGFAGVTAASMLGDSFASKNRIVYIVCLVLSALMAAAILTQEHLAPQRARRWKERLAIPFSYAFMLMLYGFSMAITFLHADVPAVSAIAMLMIIPLLFFDRPVRMVALTVFVDIVFCILTDQIKEPEIAEKDLWNGITFGLVAVAAEMFLIQVRIRSLMQSREIARLSERDLLTDTLNRNSFELLLARKPQCSGNLCCLYGDVNGLHELNNEQGHQAGDRMLQTVAHVLTEQFGSGNVYRIGGDEFVAFAADWTEEALWKSIDDAEHAIDESGYHVSFGYARMAKDSLDMNRLVREAETEMYRTKREYYEQHKISRRSLRE